MGHNEDVLKKLGKTRDELLYDSNSLFFLSENIEILHGMSEPKNLSKEIRRIIFFDIVTKYCQMVESFAAYINAFEESNKNSPSTNIIFNHLVKYRVGDILEEFKLFSEMEPKINPQFEKKIKIAFGYNNCKDVNKVNENIKNIFGLFVKIFNIYYFHEKIYNASKHGHRIFHFYNFDENENEPIVYLNKKPKDNFGLQSEFDEKYFFDFIPVSNSIIDDMIIPRTNEFKKLYNILISNNKAIHQKKFKDIMFVE